MDMSEEPGHMDECWYQHNANFTKDKANADATWASFFKWIIFFIWHHSLNTKNAQTDSVI